MRIIASKACSRTPTMQWAVMQTAVGRLAATEGRSRIAEGDLVCY